MEISVKIIKILDAQSFNSKNGETTIKNTFVGETQGQYPKNIAFSVLGEDKFKQMAIAVGGQYNVSFDVESREWQGKWFTECKAWKAVRVDGGQQQTAQPANQPAAAPAPAPAETDGGNANEDVPF